MKQYRPSSTIRPRSYPAASAAGSPTAAPRWAGSSRASTSTCFLKGRGPARRSSTLMTLSQPMASRRPLRPRRRSAPPPSRPRRPATGGPAPARVRPGPQPATAGSALCAPAAARVPPHPPACPILPVAPPGRPGAAGWPPVFSPLTWTGPRRGCAGAPAHGPAPVAVFDGSRLCLPETGPFPPYTPRGTATPAVRLVQRSSVRSALQPAKSTS